MKRFELPKMEFKKEDARKTGIFFLLAAIIYTLLHFSSKAFPVEFYENITAQSVLFVLKLFGVQGAITIQEPVLITLASGIKIEISYLCTGLMELFVIIAAIAASHGISLKKRAVGILAALIVAPLFNLFRITATIFLILNSGSIELIDFTHNILFRITLFFAIAGIYTVWFIWAVQEDIQKSKKMEPYALSRNN